MIISGHNVHPLQEVLDLVVFRSFDVAVNIEQPLAIFIRSPPVYAFVIVILPIAYAFGNDFTVDDFASVL